MSFEPKPYPYEIPVTLTVPQAYALAELCKRLGWSDARALSVDEQQTRDMLSAADCLRAGLATLGYRVR